VIRIQTEPIDVNALLTSAHHDASGATVLFLGTVRRWTAGAQTERVLYEAFAPMAESALAHIESDMRRIWPVLACHIVHRLGALQPGEISVAVVVSCPHRSQAFEACRYAIERLKQVVPIWKKETWTDGREEWIHPGACSSPDAHRHEAPRHLAPGGTS